MSFKTRGGTEKNGEQTLENTKKNRQVKIRKEGAIGREKGKGGVLKQEMPC